MVFASRSVEETVELGRALGEVAQAGECVALIGDLGAGKTHFVQAFASGLGVPPEVRVTSPTFTLVNIYTGGRTTLVHADLYRLEKEREIDELGLDDWIGGDAVVCVEWADRFGALPIDSLELKLEVVGPTERALHARAPGPEAQALLDRFATKLAAT